jgi:U3 small nucleolar RNA-associated protein 14
MNDFEKDINDILKKEKYETDEQILKKEQEELMKINPEELKKRYEEIKKIRFLLFQKEHDSKRKAKIKSKLYHKIKKKQREREEKDLLEKLGEVDPNAVNAYLEKKSIDRIKERIELKHSFNSKFNKTVKRYNLQSDLNVKEAIKENFKLRDELLKKVEGRDMENEEDDSENISNENYDDEEDNENEENEENQSEDNDSENENEEKINKTDLLLNFEDNYDTKKENKNNEKRGGVWGMKFMEEKSNADLKGKLKNVLEEVDSESFDLDDDDDNDNEINFRNKKFKNLNSNVNKKDDNSNLPLNLEGKYNARRNNKIDIDNDNDNENSKDNLNNNKNLKQKNSKITNEILNELNDDAEQALKNDKKDNFTSEEIKKIVEIEEIQKDEELFNKFLVQNETNKKEFLQKPKEELQDNPNFLSGWNSWAGDTKEIKAKDFLRKKRYQQIQERKNINEKNNNIPNPHVKINNSFDKKVKYILN